MGMDNRKSLQTSDQVHKDIFRFSERIFVLYKNAFSKSVTQSHFNMKGTYSLSTCSVSGTVLGHFTQSPCQVERITLTLQMRKLRRRKGKGPTSVPSSNASRGSSNLNADCLNRDSPLGFKQAKRELREGAGVPELAMAMAEQGWSELLKRGV